MKPNLKHLLQSRNQVAAEQTTVLEKQLDCLLFWSFLSDRRDTLLFHIQM